MSALTRRSDTHEERYFHFMVHDPMGQVHRGTVFMRKENEHHWFGRGTLCSIQDQFMRRTGRSRARHLYFQAKKYVGMFDVKPPSWDAASAMLEEEAKERLGRNIRIYV